MNKIRKMVDGRLMTLQEEYEVKKGELSREHNKMVSDLQGSIETLGVELSKTEKLIAKRQGVQKEFDELEKELIKLIKQHDEKIEEVNLATAMLETRNKQLDEYKAYLQEMSGKMTTRLRHISEMANSVNEKMSGKTIAARLDVSKIELMRIPF